MSMSKKWKWCIEMCWKWSRLLCHLTSTATLSSWTLPSAPKYPILTQSSYSRHLHFLTLMSILSIKALLKNMLRIIIEKLLEMYYFIFHFSFSENLLQTIIEILSSLYRITNLNYLNKKVISSNRKKDKNFKSITKKVI